ncbi:MAG: histidine phosphatase family protein [Bacteroidales bacterium]|nr:histidine phosphatase family protein [Bacteroidales bacterium]
MEKTWITLIRHGETEWNVAMRLQGVKDSNLTSKGLKQAELVAGKLCKRKFDIIISSDLGRAIKTAEIIASKTRLNIIRDQTLRERNFGIMEGLTREEISEKYPDVISGYMKRKVSYAIENGESLTEFYDRVTQGLNRIISIHKGEKILIITHGGVLDCMIRMVFNYPLSGIRNFTINNASINVFSVKNKQWILEEWGNVDHLRAIEKLDEID